MDRNNMLGVEIEYTYQGINSLMSYNSNIKWAKHIGEIAEIKQLKKPDNQSWDFLLLQKIDCGHIIRIYCANAGRNDYMCASIFVPWNIVISGKELAKIIDITKTELLNWNKDTSKTKLEKIFSETICDVVDIQQSSLEVSSNKVAYRFYGEYYQLHELLDNLDQPCYSSYKFVFLIDKSSNIECKTGDDLTEKPLIGSAIINPPQICNDFEPYIGNELFSKPIRKDIGSSLCVSWRRKGYKTIEKTTKISDANVVLEVPSKSEIKRLVPYDTIIVKDKKGNRIDQYTLMINKETILPNQNAEIVEESIFNVDVIVSANGYEQYCANKDLRNSCEVKLEKIKKTYRFTIPTDSLKCKKIELESKIEEDLYESPIEGYKTTNGKIDPDYDNQLVYQPFTKKHMTMLVILVLLSLCVGGCAGWFVKYYFSKSDMKNNNTEIASLKKELLTLRKELENKDNEISVLKNKPNVNSDQNSNEVKVSNPQATAKPKVSVIDYLDNNKKWNRNEMEKYPETKGLWDAMNERRFGDILKYRDNLNDSKNFIKIFKCVENNRHKTGLGKYNTTASDFDITIDTYMGKLDGAPEPKKENKVKENKEDKKTTETNNAASYV